MAKSTLDAVVAGHFSLDISPDLSGLAQPVRLAEVFAPTRLTNIGPAALGTGGVVSNTGLALRRLGIQVGLMAKCGEDILGRAALEILECEAPRSTRYIAVSKNEPTCYTIVMAPPGIDRFFLHCVGANNSFSFADLNMAAIKQARLFHFGYPTIMERVLANNGRELIRIFKAVHQLGVTTSLDMTLPDPNSPQGRLDWTKLLPRLLPYVDIFVPSVEELTFIMSPARFKKLLRRSKGGDLLDDLDMNMVMQLAGDCLQMGAKVMLVKCGRLGIYARTAPSSHIEQMGKACPAKRIRDWADREIFEPSFLVKKVVSALGAGDCAVAGFLAGLLRGVSLADALRYSTALGAQNVRVLDALSGTKSWSQTTAQIRKRPAKTPLQLDRSSWRWVPRDRHYLGTHDRTN